MRKKLQIALACLGTLVLSNSGNAQITLLQDYKNNNSATIGTYRGSAGNITFREGGFSSLFPIANTNGKEFWTISDRGVNVDCGSANTSSCRPQYDKMYAFPNYAPKIHRIRISGDSVQILRTITMKRPNGTNATGLLNPTGFGSLATEESPTDTVQNCANLALKTAAKDIWGIDAEGVVVDKDGNFWISEEGGPTIWKLNPNGVVVKRFTPYANQVGAQSIDVLIDTVFKYRKNNRGFESISITPNGKVYALIQSPILYPDKATGEATRVHRMLEIDPATNATRVFAYLNEGVIGASGSNQIRYQDWKLGDMAAINDSTFLVIEAALRGTTDTKKIYLININGATSLNAGMVYGGKSAEGLVDAAGLAANSIVPVRKTLFLDLIANGWPSALDKSEGIAIINDSTIAVCNDNDYAQTCPNADGIPVATTNLSHVITFGLKGANKIMNYIPVTTSLSQGFSGPSSSQAPYVVPTIAGAKYTSIITTTDVAPNGYKMCGTPDGLGAFDNNDGTFTLLMNHEFVPTAGIARAHGDTGAFVSKWIINKSDLSVVSGEDLIKNVHVYNPATSSYIVYNASFTSPTGLVGFNRFCSADLPAVSAFYNSATGLGTKERIFMNGEESGTEGRAMAHIATGASAGHSWELPYLGKFSWENSVASPYESDKTVVAGMDDNTPGQVYIYVGTKTNTGTDIDKAGLNNGKLYGVAVSGLLTETNASVPAAGTTFTLAPLGDVHNMTGTALNTASNTAGVTTFLRPEDGAWDPSNPSDFYFNTTNAFTNYAVSPLVLNASRVWKLHFTNPADYTLGGTITAVLDGTEGQDMLDNMTIDNSGHIILLEDVGNAAHLGKVWQYTIATDQLKQIGVHDSTRFLANGANYLTQDEETSGVIDVQAILGPGMFLTSDQAHYPIAGEAVEGGQLLAFFNPDTYNANPEINLQGSSVSIVDGDITPSTTDNTDFGGLNITTNTTKTFVIQNAGPGALNVSGISITGANAADFTLVTPPAFPLTIAAAGTQTITVKFAPSAVGARKATLNVMSNDLDENIYDVAIQGTGTAPEINLTGNSITIPDGDMTPSTVDFTDLGSVDSAKTISKSFSIQNTGTGELNISGISFTGLNTGEFSLASAPTFPLTVPAGTNQAITVQFAPMATGVRTATMNINSNDADEATYDVALKGTAIRPVGISTPSALASFVKLYPNPTGDEATVELMLKAKQHIAINVFDIQGKVVVPSIEKDYEAGDQKISLNTSSLSNGIYFVQISFGSVATKIKLVIMH